MKRGIQMEQQLVVFELADEHYGVDISTVESIIKMQEITRIPHSPSFVEGITNLRGLVLPVIDLRKRFGLEPVETSRDSRIMVVALGTVKVGMIVDAVSEVLRVPSESIEPPPSMTTSSRANFITGIAKLNDILVILLDMSKILTSDEQIELTAVA
ncbi:chemotaxis protein CheW [Leptolinea tardivitalis]|uniref:Chemotaxis protein CheW n=2 Tax=Leptolinea tardivitalis TaxID=229920 RepID=A0A0P6WXR5_9CHLR|nr:chemotaxis protein CheW [Leptolinea tardivitalis]